MRAHEIGDEIRRRRQKRGWSLSELARRAGTSAPTIHRYESRWCRFEVYTLEKLAAALGCRLELGLRPTIRPPERAVTPRALVRRLRRLFWDRRLRPSDLDGYPRWVVRRVLEYGSLQDVLDLDRYHGREAFLELIAGIRFESRKTRAFWNEMLRLEGRECTTRFSREVADACWTP